MSQEQHELPYKILGEKLKALRQNMHETVAEVSGAVEIDEQELLKIEQGAQRPDEDVLMLLINHFGMRDDDAANLWELAGYELEHDPDCDGNCRNGQHRRDDDEDYEPRQSRRPEAQTKQILTVMLLDPRVIYSDGAQVTANSNGVIIGFSQGSGTPHALTTAKIGMSREQAYRLLHTLHRTLTASEPKQLPSPKDKKDDAAA